VAYFLGHPAYRLAVSENGVEEAGLNYACILGLMDTEACMSENKDQEKPKRPAWLPTNFRQLLPNLSHAQF